MAKKMETKSARLLALLLALIMVGSVFAYMFRSSTTPSEREIKFEMGRFPKYLKYVPDGAQFIMYLDFNLKDKDSELYKIQNDAFKSQLDPITFGHLAFANKVRIKDVLIAKYPYPLYFVDVNRSKIYFAYENKEVYRGFTVKLRKNVALIDEISPFVVGYPAFVYNVADLVENNSNNYVYNYTSRVCNFTTPDLSYALLIYGDYAKSQLKSKNESIGDYYLVAYRMNGSLYEKVVAIHFIKNGFFVSTNKTKNVTYYYFKNFDDGLSVAKIGSYNLTKLIEMNPEMRIIEIKLKE